MKEGKVYKQTCNRTGLPFASPGTDAAAERVTRAAITASASPSVG
jgi:hypothetical protein